jgi:hypothetical protein
MTIKISTGLRNFLAQFGSFQAAMQNGKLEIYSGSQPANADAAVTGTLLGTITTGSASRTAEVLAVGTVTLNSGSSGSVDAITVNSVAILPAAVPYNTSLTQTAADVATAINQGISSPRYKATSSGAVITISALPGTGAGPNTYVVASTVTTLTKTDANLAGGVTAANGLKWGNASSGAIDKLSTATWSGVNAASGTAGYFRLYGSVADAGALDSALTALRMDGAIAASGSDLNMGTSFTSGATTTITSLATTVPAA